jgi:hypothetical protein
MFTVDGDMRIQGRASGAEAQLQPGDSAAASEVAGTVVTAELCRRICRPTMGASTGRAHPCQRSFVVCTSTTIFQRSVASEHAKPTLNRP